MAVCPFTRTFALSMKVLPLENEKNTLLHFTRLFVPFLYKTEINSLARVTKIKDMFKNGAYNYITSHNRPVYTSDTFLYEFYSDWVPSPAMPLVNL